MTHAIEGRYTRNGHSPEDQARARKVQRLIEVLVEATDGFADEAVALLRLVDQATRDLVADRAGVHTPSEQTWQSAVRLLQTRRETTRLLTEALRATFGQKAAS